LWLISGEIGLNSREGSIQEVKTTDRKGGQMEKSDWIEDDTTQGGVDEVDYDIADFEMPDDLAELSFDKKTFKQVCQKIKLSPEQARELWSIYTNNQVDIYRQAKEKVEQAKLQAELDEAEAAEQEAQSQQLDNIEEKLEGADGYSLSKEEAIALKNKILNDKDHPYWSDRAGDRVAAENARALILRLYQIENGQTSTVKGYLSELEAERQQQLKDILGYDPHSPRSSSYGEVSQSDKQPFRNPDSIDQPGKEVKSSSGERGTDYTLYETYP
jgi:hypothetical protein